mmetsp:Transcript_20788/g.59280  ORF Transcript_20788/g.59280 Transcript_20788/m.59280 type:complete len:205 (-) Transcript_20788:647-1261(-)
MKTLRHLLPLPSQLVCRSLVDRTQCQPCAKYCLAWWTISPDDSMSMRQRNRADFCSVNHWRIYWDHSQIRAAKGKSLPPSFGRTWTPRHRHGSSDPSGVKRQNLNFNRSVEWQIACRRHRWRSCLSRHCWNRRSCCRRPEEACFIPSSLHLQRCCARSNGGIFWFRWYLHGWQAISSSILRRSSWGFVRKMRTALVCSAVCPKM